MSGKRDTLTRAQKLALLDKLGLKPSENFGQIRDKVWRPTSNSYWATRVVGRWQDYDGVSEASIKNAKALRRQRKRGHK